MEKRCDESGSVKLAGLKEADNERRLEMREQTEEQRAEGSCVTRVEHVGKTTDHHLLDTHSLSDHTVEDNPEEVTLPAKDNTDVFPLNALKKGNASLLTMTQTHGEEQVDTGVSPPAESKEDKTYRSVLHQMLQQQRLKPGRRFKKKTLIKMARLFVNAKGWDSEETNQNRNVCTSDSFQCDTQSANDGDGATSSGETAAAPTMLKTRNKETGWKRENLLSTDTHTSTDLLDGSPQSRLKTQKRHKKITSEASKADQPEQQTYKLRKETTKADLTVETAAENNVTTPEGAILTSEFTDRSQEEVKAADSEVIKNTGEVLKSKKTKSGKPRKRRTVLEMLTETSECLSSEAVTQTSSRKKYRKKNTAAVIKRGEFAGVYSLVSSNIEVCFTRSHLDCEGQTTQHKTQPQLCVKNLRKRRIITSKVVTPEMLKQYEYRAHEEHIKNMSASNRDYQENVKKQRKNRTTSSKSKENQQEQKQTQFTMETVIKSSHPIKRKRARNCAANTSSVPADFCVSDIKTEPVCEPVTFTKRNLNRQRQRKRAAQKEHDWITTNVPAKEEVSEVQCDTFNEETIRRSPGRGRRRSVKVEEETGEQTLTPPDFPKTGRKRRHTRAHTDNNNSQTVCSSLEELPSSRSHSSEMNNTGTTEENLSTSVCKSSPKGRGKTKIKSEPAEMLVSTAGASKSKKIRRRGVMYNTEATNGGIAQEVTSQPEDTLTNTSLKRPKKCRRTKTVEKEPTVKNDEIFSPDNKNSKPGTPNPKNMTKPLSKKKQLVARRQKKPQAAPEASVTGSSLPENVCENIKDKKKRKGKRAIESECVPDPPVSSLNPSLPKDVTVKSKKRCRVKSEPQDCLISPEITGTDKKQPGAERRKKSLVEEEVSELKNGLSGSLDHKKKGRKTTQPLQKLSEEMSKKTKHKKRKTDTRSDESQKIVKVEDTSCSYEPQSICDSMDVNTVRQEHAEKQTSLLFQNKSTAEAADPVKTTKTRRSSKTVRKKVKPPESTSSTSKPGEVKNASNTKQLKTCSHQKSLKPLECRFCGRSFRHISAFKLHKRIHTGEKPYSCSTCGKRFSKLPQLNLHLKLHSDSGAIRCPCCGVSFQSKYEFLRHFKIHLNDTDAPKPQKETEEALPLRCPVCLKEFTKRATFRMHRWTHSRKPFTCSICRKNFRKSSSLHFHERTHWPVKPYSCSVCLKAFNKLQELQSHSQTHSGPALLSSSSFKALHSQPDVCSSQKQVDGFLVCQSADGAVVTPIYFKCPICKQLHHHWCHYILHLQTHTGGESSPPCKTCRQQYGHAAENRRHCMVCCKNSGEEKVCGSSLSDIWKEEETQETDAEQMSHISASPHEETAMQPLLSSLDHSSLPVREDCAVSGPSPSSRFCGHFAKRRLHLCHTSRPFHCSRCDVQFHFLGSYIDHLREHAAQAPSASTSCPHPSASEISTSSHISDRPFKCSTCGKHFSTQINLKKHKLLHKGTKSHLCLQCYLPFSSSSALNAHLKTHKKRLSVPQPDGVVEPLFFPYHCKKCEAKFSSTDLLQAHQVCHFTAGRAPEERPLESVTSYVLNRNTNEEDDVQELSQPKQRLPVSNKKHLFRYPHPDRLYVVPIVSSELPTVISDTEEETPSVTTSAAPQQGAGLNPDTAQTSADQQQTTPAGSDMDVNDSNDSDTDSYLTPLIQCTGETEVIHRCALCTDTFSDMSELHQHYLHHARQV